MPYALAGVRQLLSVNNQPTTLPTRGGLCVEETTMVQYCLEIAGSVAVSYLSMQAFSLLIGRMLPR